MPCQRGRVGGQTGLADTRAAGGWRRPPASGRLKADSWRLGERAGSQLGGQAVEEVIASLGNDDLL